MSQHDCPICQRTRRFREAMERIPKEDEAFWSDIFSALNHAESDRDYYHAIVEGSWPSADEVIAKHRAKPSDGTDQTGKV